MNPKLGRCVPGTLLGVAMLVFAPASLAQFDPCLINPCGAGCPNQCSIICGNPCNNPSCQTQCCAINPCAPGCPGECSVICNPCGPNCEPECNASCPQYDVYGVCDCPGSDCEPVATGFTYQGRLRQGSAALNGSNAADLRFTLFTGDTGGTQVGPAVTVTGVDFDQGLFTVDLDFGFEAFDGNARWLQVEVAVPPGGAFTALAPRQALSATPYALAVVGVDGHSLDSVDGSITDAVFVASNGRVGVGTTSPQTGLHITQASGITLGVNSAAGGYTALQMQLSQASGGYAQIEAVKASGSAWGDLVLNLNAGRVGIGTASPQQKLDVNGTTRTKVLQITGGSDVAEPYRIAPAGDMQAQPGMVVAIDPADVGALRVAQQAYDRTVAGIISGANGINPGLTLTQEGSVADGSLPVASVGRVWCWVDADVGGPIVAGDLLTTSTTPGHAMRVVEPDRANGAILGKAMSSLEHGRGLVLVLVALQ